jgi:uncharacterized membrane protein YesL
LLTLRQTADRLLRSFSEFGGLILRETPRLILLNILFWGTGLFVVTLPPALTGLFGVLSDYTVNKRPETTLSGYWDYMTARPLRSLFIGTGYAAAVFAAFSLAGFYLGAASEGQALMYLPFALCALLCVFLLWCGFYLPLLLAAGLPVPVIIKGAFLLAACFPLLNAALLGFLGLMAMTAYFRPAVAMVFFAVAGFSFWGLLIAHLCLPNANELVIRPYELRMSRLRRTGTNASRDL